MQVERRTLPRLGRTSSAPAAAPADAQRYRGYRNNDNTGTAIIAGIAGLAIGAAIVASSNNNDRRYRQRGYVDGGNGYGYNDGRYDDRRGYDDRGYRDGYQNRGYPAQGYGNQGYGQGYGGYDGQGAYGGCHVENRYDRYARRTIAVRVCN